MLMARKELTELKELTTNVRKYLVRILAQVALRWYKDDAPEPILAHPCKDGTIVPT